MFGTTKKDLKSKQYKRMREYQENNDNLPDGAFFQLHEDWGWFYEDNLPDGAFFQLAEDIHGWTHKDWGWFYELDELNPF